MVARRTTTTESPSASDFTQGITTNEKTPPLTSLEGTSAQNGNTTNGNQSSGKTEMGLIILAAVSLRSG